jgi:hypothetical protein
MPGLSPGMRLCQARTCRWSADKTAAKKRTPEFNPACAFLLIGVHRSVWNLQEWLRAKSAPALQTPEDSLVHTHTARQQRSSDCLPSPILPPFFGHLAYPTLPGPQLIPLGISAPNDERARAEAMACLRSTDKSNAKNRMPGSTPACALALVAAFTRPAETIHPRKGMPGTRPACATYLACGPAAAGRHNKRHGGLAPVTVFGAGLPGTDSAVAACPGLP